MAEVPADADFDLGLPARRLRVRRFDSGHDPLVRGAVRARTSKAAVLEDLERGAQGPQRAVAEPPSRERGSA